MSYDDGTPPAEPSAPEPFGDRLRRLREEWGLSVAEVAVAVGVSVRALRRLEARGSAPNLLLGLRLADALHVDPYFLETGGTPSLADALAALERQVAMLDRRVAALEERL